MLAAGQGMSGMMCITVSISGFVKYFVCCLMGNSGRKFFFHRFIWASGCATGRISLKHLSSCKSSYLLLLRKVRGSSATAAGL